MGTMESPPTEDIAPTYAASGNPSALLPQVLPPNVSECVNSGDNVELVVQDVTKDLVEVVEIVKLSLPPSDGESAEAASNKKKPAEEMIPFHKLFQYADRLDYLYILIGSLGALGFGSVLPLWRYCLPPVVSLVAKRCRALTPVQACLKAFYVFRVQLPVW